MRITLYIPGMPFNGDTLKTQSLGGSESQGYYTAVELAKKHDVTVFSNCSEVKKIDGVVYRPIGEITQQAPFGKDFIEYSVHAPVDVLIAQRTPNIFQIKYNSKINIWWTHDLAIKRSKQAACAHLWNVDQVLAVSQWHKEQIKEVYGIKDSFISVYKNGVADINNIIDQNKKFKNKTLFYSSRPERGLENLVKPDGIMEQLYKIDPAIKLQVCGYDNTTQQMANYYNYLFELCEKAPNVELLGFLNKKDLYKKMSESSLHVYPTDFEETSCITVMEQQANGTPIICTGTGALSETLLGGGAVFCEKEEFAAKIVEVLNDKNKWDELSNKARAKNYNVDIQPLEQIIEKAFEKRNRNKETVFVDMLYNSDVMLAKEYAKQNKLNDFEINKHFGRILSGENEQVYAESAHYNTDVINNNHRLGDFEFQLSMPRVQAMLESIKRLPKGAKVLDYGCCVGQITSALASLRQDCDFTGVDISQQQVDIANKFATDNKINNLNYFQASKPSDIKEKFDLVICSEVLEHIVDPVDFLTELEKLSSGYIILTTPYGAFEAQREDSQPREHLHNFEAVDMFEMLGHKKDFMCGYIPYNTSQRGDTMGYNITAYKADNQKIKNIDLERKLKTYAASRQTLAVCMICKGESDTLNRTLRSVKPIANEIIIGIDGHGNSWEIAEKWGAVTFKAESPSVIGFDAARNKTIELASSDWILWIDDDEELVFPYKLLKYLRLNQYDAYAVHQHHYSAEPALVIKTDLPCRIFRNNDKIKFFGIVHEHPETDVNKGAGDVMLLTQQECSIAHYGYGTEEIRRKRFERNFPLMQKDREKYPGRHLGKFLWIRDLTQLNRFEFLNTRQVSENMVGRAEEALRVWRELLADGQVKMVQDCMEYASDCADIVTRGAGIKAAVNISVNIGGLGDDLNKDATIKGIFANKKDFENYNTAILKEKLELADCKYL